jgi:hypothetical protein
MRLFAACLLIAALSACHRQDEENIQARAEKDSEQLHQRYNEIQAEAENDIDAQTGPLDNESTNLLNQMNGAVPVTGNNAAEAAPSG